MPLHARYLFLGTLVTCLLLSHATNAGVNEAFDNILMSKVNGVAMMQIWPACKMDYVSHTPAEAGTEMRIRINTSSECVELLSEVTTEIYRPIGRRMGNVDEVVFDAINRSDAYITLRFKKPQKYEVRQHTIGWIEIFVDTNVDSASLPAAAPPPLVAPRAPQPTRRVFATTEPQRRSFPSPRVSPERCISPEQSTRLQVSPGSTGNFVVQLGVFESVDRAVTELLKADTPHFAYTTEFTVNGQTWRGLQVGFFDTEATAEVVLNDLRATFPDSWVRYVEPQEAQTARGQGELRASSPNLVPAVRVSRPAADSSTDLSGLMANGRQAVLDRRYGDAVDSYTRVLEYPQHEYRAQAREFIGVAHERNGQRASAIAEYQAFLREFPDDEGTLRVESRLSSLQTAASRVAANPLAQQQADEGGWQLFGGVSQYYWRNQEQLVHDGNDIVSGSGVLALGDFSAVGRGDRFDVLARMNGAYQFNLVEYDDTGDIGWMSDAYVHIVDHKLGLQGKIGRQTRHSDGILGRFDGAALSYQWKPDISFSVSSGFPIDSPRYMSGSQRFFYAAGARIENLWEKISVNAYTHQQTVDGLSDRQAVGGEIHYRDGSLSVVGLVDYDASYNVLNSALVNGTWLLENGWRLNAMVDFGAQPYLTTRNALAGQTVRSVDELLQTYTEGQIRTLARDRTAQASTASFGLSMRLWERFYLSLDVSTRQSDATVASGGVAAMPATGSQMFYNATLVGTGLLRDGDLTILTVRHDSTRTRDSTMLLLDTRLPFGEGLRINPRVTLTQRTLKEDGTDQLIVSPALRVIYRWRRLMLDLEAGGRWSNRDLPPDEFDPFTADGTEELTGLFLNLGYRLEF